MIKKLILLLMVFLLIGCTPKEEIIEETIEYIDPVKDVFIFSELVTDFIAVVKWHDRG